MYYQSSRNFGPNAAHLTVSVLVYVKYQKAIHEARSKALEGPRISSKRHSRSVTETRELLEGTK